MIVLPTCLWAISLVEADFGQSTLQLATFACLLNSKVERRSILDRRRCVHESGRILISAIGGWLDPIGKCLFVPFHFKLLLSLEQATWFATYSVWWSITSTIFPASTSRKLATYICAWFYRWSLSCSKFVLGCLKWRRIHGVTRLSYSLTHLQLQIKSKGRNVQC